MYRIQRDLAITIQEPLVLALRKQASSRLVERMAPAENLVQYDPESPHIDLSVITGGDSVLVVRVAVHLGSNVWMAADLRD